MELLPGVMLTFALLVFGITISVLRRRSTNAAARRTAGAAAPARHQRRSLHRLRACVAVCPTDVLELAQNKSRVARFHDCIQCEQCVLVCPTTALVMFPRGTTPPPYRMPALDEF